MGGSIKMQDDEYWEGLCWNGPKHGVTLFSGTSNFRCLVTYKIMCRAFFFFYIINTSSCHLSHFVHIIITHQKHSADIFCCRLVLVFIWHPKPHAILLIILTKHHMWRTVHSLNNLFTHYKITRCLVHFQHVSNSNTGITTTLRISWATLPVYFNHVITRVCTTV